METIALKLADFQASLIGYFEIKDGMRARDLTLAQVVRDSAFAYIEDMADLAALLSGVVGTTIRRPLRDFLFEDDDEAVLDETALNLAGYAIELGASVRVKLGEHYDAVAVLLKMLPEAKWAELAAYLLYARELEADKGADISYELYVPERQGASRD